MNESNFEQMNLSPEVMRVIRKKKFDQPTQVQAQTIPPMLEWRDIIAKAPTGTGKTFAFGIPIVEHVDITDGRVQALILAPTRELAIQISTELRDISEYINGIKVVCIYGGQHIALQFKALRRCPQIVVATPGRLLDHINRRTVFLDTVQTVVLDEADRMVDMGFFKDVTKILDMMPQMQNLALLSATLSTDVMTIGWKYQRDAVEITVQEDVESKPDILQYSIKLTEMEKPKAIARIIEDENFERSIVFCNTKSKVERITKMLSYKGFSVDCIHGDIRQSVREKVLKTFRNGDLRILVATDVASRGLDIDDVDAIFNCDIPDENEYYVHRIGRTGRAKKHGVSYTFVASIADSVRLREISRCTRSQILPLTIDFDGKPAAVVTE
ncbi:MAG: DEAD/DEAH box helicase [Eubacteriales bacterium]